MNHAPFEPGDLVQIWGTVCTVVECRWIPDAWIAPYWRVKSTWNGYLDAPAADYTLVRKRLPTEVTP